MYEKSLIYLHDPEEGEMTQEKLNNLVMVSPVSRWLGSELFAPVLVIKQPHSGGKKSPLTVVHSQPKKTFVVQRSHQTNLNHMVYDDHVPFFWAMRDLGVSLEEMRKTYILLKDHHLGIHFWGESYYHPRLDQTYKGVIPEGDRKTFHDYDEHIRKGEADAKGVLHDRSIVMFPWLAVGTGARSGHDFTSSYHSPGVRIRIHEQFRRYYLENFGFQDVHLRRDGIKAAGASPPVNPFEAGWNQEKGDGLNMLIVLKKEKRRIVNSYVMAQRIKEAFPHAKITELYWEDVESYQKELEICLETDIMITADGTGALNAMYLRPGSVLLTVGRQVEYGAPGHLADWIYNSYTHIRVLYFTKMRWYNTHGGTNPRIPFANDLDVTVNPEKLIGTILEAIYLWRKKFYVPVRFGDNASLQGMWCQRLMRKYPLVFVAMRFGYVIGCTSFLYAPKKHWKRMFIVMRYNFFGGREEEPPEWGYPEMPADTKRALDRLN